jgi:hypothetical protein
VLDEANDGEAEAVKDDEAVGTAEAPWEERGWAHPTSTSISPIPMLPVRKRGRLGWFM